MADEEITVEVPVEALTTEDGTPVVIKDDKPEDEVRKTDDKDAGEDLKSQFLELQERVSTEQRAREAAERRQRESDEARRAAEARASDGEFATITQGIAAAEAEALAAMQEQKAAYEEGDWTKATEANRKIARAEAALGRLQDTKAEMEARKAAPRQEQRTEQRRQDDPVEAFISSRTPAAQSWLRAHREYAEALARGTDDPTAVLVNRAHSHAIGEGYDMDTPEYFAHIERRLGLRDAPKQQQPKQQPQPQRRAASVPVAPVNAGSAGSNSNGGGRQVVLTPGEAKVATDGTLTWSYDDPSGKGRFKKGDPIGTAEYARRKLMMKERGDYDRQIIDQ